MGNLANFRYLIATVILVGHLGSSTLLISFWLAGGYTFDEMINVFAVIAPMFAVYLSLMINFAFNDPLKNEPPLNPLAKLFASVFPIAFSLMMMLAITLKAFNAGLQSIDHLIKFLGIIETVMGTYVATVVKNLFPPPLAQ
ncbi:hypothetical protein [Bradyrhizobium erythrophlei]|uniref:Uncharacterized protein n=1 Tax=Bradyrhizobium erythrophlei TaxID=1437360 RepID=A0A1M5HII4_9BRAD|nr:hypothetical protein [Bradyrhizobium erythrophlei]SHG15745.1 hypothetical protein SAMN05444169_0845 [Bradyrhizobium erythrophlei]